MCPDPAMDSAELRRRSARVFARLSREPGIAELAAARREVDACFRQPHLIRVRVACVASFTIDPLRTSLELQLLKAGFSPEIFVAPFGQYEQQLLDPASGLAEFAADAVIWAVRLRDVCPAVYDAFNSLSAGEARAAIDDWLQRLSAGLKTFRARSEARILLQNFEVPNHPALGIADAAAEFSQVQLIRGANQRMLELARSFEDVHVMDYDLLISGRGANHWSDPRMSLFGRIAVAPAHQWHLAGFYVRHLRPLHGLARKVLCLDADNTLWGGVIGDVGIDGIELGHDYPGNAFVAMQKAVLDLHRRGVLLCLNSKNEEATVLEALDKHPAMILRKEHFASWRVNWQPKPDNMRSMAEELNLGLDSFVFVDDQPVECELVRESLPEVLCIALPSEPAHYEEVIRSLDCFDQWKVTSEDRSRGTLYRAEVQRRELSAAAVDMPTFFRQLQMQMTISVDNPAHAGRAAQMTQRTNQFNMNTIRCSEDEIRRWIAASDFHVITLQLADRFGDNGIVGAAVVRRTSSEWHLHMLLMSCRILGRTVEQAFVRWIAGRAKSAGVAKLTATYVPTSRNKPFQGFYDTCGFVREHSDHPTCALTLDRAETALPEYITLIESPVPEKLQ